jgi:hypothetical protein
MSEQGPSQWLESLRSEGAGRLDPARFRFLEALSRRLPGQTEPVRRLLEDKLQVGLADYARRFAEDKLAVMPDKRAVLCPLTESEGSPLAQLNQFIRGVHEPDELASVRRFRQAWSSNHIHDKVEQAASRKPPNAGPLNSHLLVLHSLSMLGELSGDYLRRFLVQVESLQWLDQASEKYSPRPVKPARSRQKKQGSSK